MLMNNEILNNFNPILKGKLRKEKWGGLYYFRDLVYIDVINEVAYDILNMCNGANSIYEIIKRLSEEYDASEDLIVSDVVAYLNQLYVKGHLIIDGYEDIIPKIETINETDKEVAVSDEVTNKVLGGNGILGVAPNELSAPIKVLIEFTHNCNLKCIHCFAGAEYCTQTELGYLDGELSTQQWFRIIDDISEAGVFDIFISGGEALMRKDIFDIMDYIRSKDMGFCLLTNTTLIDDDLAYRLKKAGCYKVESNLDGYDAATYDAFRGVDGSFEATVRGIKACLNNGIGVRCNLTETRQNVNDIKKVLEVAYEIGVRELCVVPLEPGGRAQENWEEISLSIDERIALSQTYVEIAKWVEEKFNKEFFFAAPLDIYQIEDSQWIDIMNPGKFYPICGAGKLHCSIGPKGDVILCPTAGSTIKINPGNCLETKFEKIWKEGDIFKSLRENEVPGCKDCEYINCGGGCGVRSYLKYGAVAKGPTEFCKKRIVNRIREIEGVK